MFRLYPGCQRLVSRSHLSHILHLSYVSYIFVAGRLRSSRQSSPGPDFSRKRAATNPLVPRVVFPKIYLKMTAVCGLESLWRHQWVGPIKDHTAETLKQVSIEKSQVLPRHLPKCNKCNMLIIHSNKQILQIGHTPVKIPLGYLHNVANMVTDAISRVPHKQTKQVTCITILNFSRETCHASDMIWHATKVSHTKQITGRTGIAQGRTVTWIDVCHTESRPHRRHCGFIQRSMLLTVLNPRADSTEKSHATFLKGISPRVCWSSVEQCCWTTNSNR